MLRSRRCAPSSFSGRSGGWRRTLASAAAVFLLVAAGVVALGGASDGCNVCDPFACPQGQRQTNGIACVPVCPAGQANDPIRGECIVCPALLKDKDGFCVPALAIPK